MGFGEMKRLEAKNKAYAFALLAMLVGCTNQPSLNLNGKQGTVPTNTSNSGDFITLSKVVKSNISPTSMFDLVGDGSGEVGQLCFNSGSGVGAGTGPSTCECAYTFTLNNSAQDFKEPTVYFEGNLIRCSYSTIPAGATNLKVSIHHIPTDFYSNEISVNTNSLSSSLDPTEATSFIEVQRYQARDFVFVPSLFPGAEVYDPIQSESTRLSYPLNFYTSNPGGSLLALLIESGNNNDFSKFEVSINAPNQPSWLNLNIYSNGPDTNGSKLIYPPSGSAFDRSTFLVARKPAGVFTKALNSFIAPGILSTSPDSAGLQPQGTYAPVGYVASAIPTANGETCPTSASIPSGYHWVKIYAFRGTLAPRFHVTGSQEILDTAAIACNKGRFDGDNTSVLDGTAVRDQVAIFPDCEYDTNTNDYLTIAPLSSPNAQGLASRVLFNTRVCVTYPRDLQQEFFATGGFVPVTNQRAGQTTIAPTIASSYPAGTDLWERVGEYSVATNNVANNWNLEPADFKALTGTAGAGFAAGDQSAPSDSQIFQSDSIDDGQARFNYIFVVTPITVMKSTLENQLPGHEPYTPFTYKRLEDCSAPDPDANATCVNNAAQKTPYALWSAPISADPGASSTGNFFPVCALQPN